MRITQVRDEFIIKAIERKIRASPQGIYHNKLFQVLKDYKLYLYGGALRDILSCIINMKRQEIRDFDWIVDDKLKPNPDHYIKGFKGMTRNRFGNFKWLPCKGVEMDIIPFSNADIILKKKINEQRAVSSIEEILFATDFTPNSLAYSVNEQIIYNFKAIQAIKSKIFEINKPKDYDHVTLAKIILQSEKLGYAIGPRAREFIESKYSSGLDDKIKDYLNYKRIANKYNHVISRLNNIQQATRDK